MKVLLIGGTMFIGRSVADELVASGHEICFLHRGEHEPDGLQQATHIHVDRKDIASAKDAIDAFAPDVVFDNMAMSRADAESAIAAFDQNVRFVVTSSMDVYRAYSYVVRNEAAAESVPITETSPVRDERYPYRGQMPGMDDYEKLDVEDSYLARGATILRLPIVYGPRDGQRREWSILRRVVAGRDRVPIGSGAWLASKGFVWDVARGIRLACESDGARGEIFNLGEQVTYPMDVWSQMILDAAGSDAKLVRVPEDKLPEDMGMTGTIAQDLLVDSSKARSALGWKDSDAREALRVSVSWHLTNPPKTQDPGFEADDAALAAASA